MRKHFLAFILAFAISAPTCFVPVNVRASPTTITVPDDYSTIQAAINAANAGDTVFVRNATYYENVVVNKTLCLVGESREATIVDGGWRDSAIMIVADNVTVESFTAKSSRHLESGTMRASVRLRGVKYCNITANILIGGDVGVYLDASSNNDIGHNNVTTTLWTMRLTNMANANSIHDNEIVNSLFSLDLLGSSNENIIFNNTLTDTEGISLSRSCFGNVITANTFSDSYLELGSARSWYWWIVWERSRYWWIVQNTTVTHNTFINGGIFAGSTYGNTVENNTVSGKPVVYLEGVSDRKINYAGQVILINCSRVQIENLDLRNAYVGVELRECHDVEVTGSNMTGGRFGIVLYNASNTNITGNTLKDGGATAMWLQSSSNNTISQNSIVDNEGYGMQLQNSDNNRIFHNNLIGNAWGWWVWKMQAIIEESRGNLWDGGYPLGGNYWGDYNGSDIYNGPYQNESGSDWIGDTPYVIDQDNSDRYPLMRPFVPETDEIRLAYRNLLLQNGELRSNFEALNYTYNELLVNYCQLISDIEILNQTYSQFLDNFDKLLSNFTTLNMSFDKFKTSTQNDLSFLTDLVYAFVAVTVILAGTTAYVVIRKPKPVPKPETKEEPQRQPEK